MKKIPPIAIIIVIILAVVLGVYFFKKSAAPTDQNQQKTQLQIQVTDVILDKTGFTTKEVKIKRGGGVKFLNKSGVTAVIASDPHPTHNLYRVLNLGQFADGSSVVATFDKSGSYTYHNHLIPKQTGTIIVE